MLNSETWTPDALRGLQRQLRLKEIDYYPQIDSTNSAALTRIRGESIDTPMLVLANEQVAGRGRSDNQWWSTTGALTFSLVISLHPPERVQMLPLVMGVGVARALNEFRGRHSEVHLKWPNDLFWGERKLAGLLVESVSGKDALVVGCGINVNQRMEEAPEDFRHHSISMYDRCGEMFQLPKVLERVLWHMLRVDDEFRRGETGWQSEFRKACWLTGHIVQVKQGEQAWVGRCVGIDDHGQLTVETEQGVTAVSSGTIRRMG